MHKFIPKNKKVEILYIIQEIIGDLKNMNYKLALSRISLSSVTTCPS